MERLEPATDRFREEFKRYKKRDADLSDVIDLTRPKQYGEKVRMPENVMIRDNV